MPDAEHAYEDRWGEIIDRPSADLLELRWFDTTDDLSAEQFQRWLVTFADHVEQRRRSKVLVDGTRFLMNPANMDAGWRDANIIPRYNAAGVARFAFLFLPGMPAIGAPPGPEGPGTFPTGYFGTRQEALDWLLG
jgi:hypothetical protein